MKDSYKKVCEDLAKGWKWEWIDMGLKLRTLPWEKSNELVERSRALVKADKRRKKA